MIKIPIYLKLESDIKLLKISFLVEISIIMNLVKKPLINLLNKKIYKKKIN